MQDDEWQALPAQFATASSDDISRLVIKLASDLSLAVMQACGSPQ